jgi:hypothetical protein
MSSPLSIVGGYAAAQADLAGSPELEADWYRLLRSKPQIGGLELAFDHGIHPGGVTRLAQLLDPAWRSVVTCVFSTGRRLAEDPLYGLASNDVAGRERAVRSMADVHADVSQLLSIMGPGAIVAIEVQSAPNVDNARSSIASFAASLAEIASWPWHGVAIMVEHCDAKAMGHVPQKGYLQLEEEIATVHEVASLATTSRSGTTIGHTINWARSVIESRDATKPLVHLKQLRDANTKVALMFSGVSPKNTRFGEAWADAHLPVARLKGNLLGTEASSLLTEDRMSAAITQAGPLLYTGVKVSAGVGADSGMQRLEPTIATFEALMNATDSSSSART